MSRSRISRVIVFAALAVCFLLTVPTPAAAQRVGIGIGFYGGGPFYPYGYYGPWGYPSYGYAGYDGPYGYGPYGRPMGEVHIKSPNSDAQIFVNGSFAGRARDLKRFYLAPGTYNIEQRIGNDVQRERVYVLANRNVTVEFGKPGTAPPVAAPHAPSNAAPNPPPYSAPAPEANPQPQSMPQPPQSMPPPPPPQGPDTSAAPQSAPEAQRL